MVNEKLELIAQTFNSTQYESNQAIAIAMLRAGDYELEDLARLLIGEYSVPNILGYSVNFTILDINLKLECETKTQNGWFEEIIPGRYTIGVKHNLCHNYDMALYTDYAGLKSHMFYLVTEIIKEISNRKIHETSTT